MGVSGFVKCSLSSFSSSMRSFVVDSEFRLYFCSISCFSFSAFSGFSFVTTSIRRLLIFSLVGNVSHPAGFFNMCLGCLHYFSE